jgi:hypothetical protein
MQLRKVSTLIAATVLVGTLASCSMVDGEINVDPTKVAAVTEEIVPALPEIPVIDITTGAPAAGTNEALAWEALMGPDGEYAAAASYAAVLDAYGQVEPYATIYQAELKHVDALIKQLDRAGIVAPANPYMGKIEAPADLTTAAQAWAEGEILNVEMYDVLIAQSTDTNLTRVLNNLRSASLDSHLPLFELAAANGGTLTAEQMANRG